MRVGRKRGYREHDQEEKIKIDGTCGSCEQRAKNQPSDKLHV